MDSATLAARPASGATSYEVMLRASVATRFKLRDRWLIAASSPDEAGARREFAALCQEFPGETVHLRLVRSSAGTEDGQYHDRVLDSREPTEARPRHALRATPSPRARSRATAPERSRMAQPPPALPSDSALRWRLAGAATVAALLLCWLLR